jgi:hypothetical protein
MCSLTVGVFFYGYAPLVMHFDHVVVSLLEPADVLACCTVCRPLSGVKSAHALTLWLVNAAKSHK